MAEKIPQHLRNRSSSKLQTPAVDLDEQIIEHQNTAQIVSQFGEHSSPADVLRLQRTLGNQAVLSMIQRSGVSQKSGTATLSRVGQQRVQRVVDEEGVPTDLDPVTDAAKISGLKDQYKKFQKNLTDFWDSYKLEHPANAQELFQQIWGYYLEGLKAGAASQSGLATVKDVNDQEKRIEAPGYKSVLGVKSLPHPAAKPRTAEEQALADEMGVMRLQMADDAVSALHDLVEAFSAQFDKAIDKVQQNSQVPWYKPWMKQKVPNYIFWSGPKANKYVEQNHSPDDSIQLEMTMGKMAWLDGLGYDRNTKAPNAVTAYTGQNFQIWTALSERYALKAAAEVQKGRKWNFIGYMSDVAVDEQSVYNTIERPTIVKHLGVDLDITWKLIDEDPVTKKLYIAMESKNRQDVIEELKRREALKPKP